MSRWRDHKRAAARALHATMGVPAVYLTTLDGDPLRVEVRVHTDIQAVDFGRAAFDEARQGRGGLGELGGVDRADGKRHRERGLERKRAQLQVGAHRVDQRRGGGQQLPAHGVGEGRLHAHPPGLAQPQRHRARPDGLRMLWLVAAVQAR